jgi:hypothetical protein
MVERQVPMSLMNVCKAFLAINQGRMSGYMEAEQFLSSMATHLEQIDSKQVFPPFDLIPRKNYVH